MSEQQLELLVTQLKSLSTDQRQQVHDKAAEIAIGKPPRKEEVEVSKLTGLDKGIIAALVIVFLSAVFLSATRIVILGYELTGHIVSNQVIAALSGLLVLTLAEVASIVFITALSKYNDKTSRIIFYGLTIASVIFSVLGNLAIERPWISAENIFYSAFAWLLAILPPVFVMGVGYALKTILLDRFKERYATELKYEQAVKDYERYLSDVETHPRFSKRYAQLLVEAVLTNNLRYGNDKTKSTVESLLSDKTIEEQSYVKRLIAKREMSADTWFDSDSESKSDNDKLESRPKIVDNVMLEKTNEVPNGTQTVDCQTDSEDDTIVDTKKPRKAVKNVVEDNTDWDQLLADNLPTIQEAVALNNGVMTKAIEMIDTTVLNNAITKGSVSGRTIRRKIEKLISESSTN